MARKAKSAPATIAFEGDLTIRGIPGAYERLRSALAGGASVLATVAEDAAIDLTFVQLIEAARRSARDSGTVFALAAPASGALLETLRRGGFLETAPHREFWLLGDN